MTDPQLAHGRQPWEQLTLFQPDAVTVEMILHISDRRWLIDGGVRATETISGAALWIEANHYPSTVSGIAEATASFHSAARYWSGVVWGGHERQEAPDTA
jgi:hypothetical protein